MAKKEARRAARNTGKLPERGLRPPTVRRALIQGAILAGVYLLLVRWVFNTEERGLYIDVLWTGIFFFMYAGLIYVWEKFLYTRRLRKRQGQHEEGEKNSK